MRELGQVELIHQRLDVAPHGVAGVGLGVMRLG
jgi:hypothetical protein